ncbi:peroxidase 39-like [Papaver somniferum]|uniref:peroxidase 39-like n=1 Tax=Papaver somniferum TaxID=3469 RepID=UPI000E7015FE|nr:peroxidase 39-like [Papaver somniferum]
MKTNTSFLLFATVLVVVLIGTLTFEVCDGAPHGKALKLKFYDKTCPKAQQIIKTVVEDNAGFDPFLGALLLRMHYHDCFVRGCDGSILLDPTSKTQQVELQAEPNLSLLGFDVIDDIKTQVEAACPQTVSCADIVALVARDAISAPFGRQMWKVPLGRRDGRVSRASEAIANLPSASSNFSALLQLFVHKGLNIIDLVALSGAHTVGIAHCDVISRRLFNFTGKGDTDPSIDPTYAKSVKAHCSANSKNIVEMDPRSSFSFDTHYYKNLIQKRGLFESDASLVGNPFSAKLVNQFQNADAFFAQFAKSMKKMGAMDVLAGNQGEIRKTCHLRN